MSLAIVLSGTIRRQAKEPRAVLDIDKPVIIEGKLSFGYSDPYEPGFANIGDIDLVPWLQETYWDGQTVRITVEVIKG